MPRSSVNQHSCCEAAADQQMVVSEHHMCIIPADDGLAFVLYVPDKLLLLSAVVCQVVPACVAYHKLNENVGILDVLHRSINLVTQQKLLNPRQTRGMVEWHDSIALWGRKVMCGIHDNGIPGPEESHNVKGQIATHICEGPKCAHTGLPGPSHFSSTPFGRHSPGRFLYQPRMQCSTRSP